TPSGGATPSAAVSASPAAQPTVYTGKGYKVTIPVGWEKRAITNGYEFRDPKQTRRYVRVQVYSGKNVDSAIESKEKDLQKPANCEIYERIGVSPASLNAVRGSRLEYLCTPKNEDQRHGTYTVITSGGKTYRIQTSTWSDDYDQTKPIFEAFAGSFTLTT
ncbi:MAG: hypothetical protein HOV79_19155, partial [Hamadaea sp.]|nr:hypothetical protein [Hamadaea sp.]